MKSKKLYIPILTIILIIVLSYYLYTSAEQTKLDIKISRLDKKETNASLIENQNLTTGINEERVIVNINNSIIRNINSLNGKIYTLSKKEKQNKDTNVILDLEEATNLKERIIKTLKQNKLCSNDLVIHDYNDSYKFFPATETDLLLGNNLPQTTNYSKENTSGYYIGILRTLDKAIICRDGEIDFFNINKNQIKVTLPCNDLSIQFAGNVPLLKYHKVRENLSNKKFSPFWSNTPYGNFITDGEDTILVVDNIVLSYINNEKVFQPVFHVCGYYKNANTTNIKFTEGDLEWCGIMPAVDYDQIPKEYIANN